MKSSTLSCGIFGLLLVGVVGCNSAQPSPPALATGTGTSIRIQGDAYVDAVFSPRTLTTTAGSTVRWTNSDSVAHSSISDSGVWQANSIQPNGTYEFTFATAGTYPYKCLIHPGMTGTVIVQ
jgi:plastocyanin